jgi:MFS transporter, PAT family, beta-lactamase induction signal transducer AmpG
MTTEVEPAPARRTLLAALRVYTERPALVMVALGFAGSLPYFLIFDTLSAWFRATGISLEVIGFFSLVTLVATFKFLWAPIIDRTEVPLLTRSLGHRRSWMLVCQGAIVIGLWLISASDPAQSLGAIAIFAVLVGFSSATQDIAIDAWRIETAGNWKQGVMAAAYQWGYRGGMIVAGAAPLLLAQFYGWNVSYAVMATLMIVGVAGVLAAPKERHHVIRPFQTGDIPPAPVRDAMEWGTRLAILASGALLLGSGLAANAAVLGSVLAAVGAGAARDAALEAWKSEARVWVHLSAAAAGAGIIALAAVPLPHVRTRPGVYLSSALADPLRDFFSRYRAAGGLILALICFYRIPDFVLNIMNPFYLDLGYSLVEIAEIRKVYGVAVTMFGVFAGGVVVARYGILRAMVVGAFAGPVSNLLFIWLAVQGHSRWALFAAIGLDNVAGGFAATCLIAYMSSLTSAGFTATQYALFSSLYMIPGRLLASQSGRIVESAARSADAGGLLSRVKDFVMDQAPANFATAIERSGVTPGALGTGYIVFFSYSAVLGAFAVVLSLAVLRRSK